MTFEHLENVIGQIKAVDIEDELVKTARGIGTSFGD
jgi:hypothetical protein